MKMTPEAFHTWSQHLRLSPETETLIASIRSSPPIRRVSGRAGNITGRYPSPKMGVSIQFESERMEFWAIFQMERDEDVLEYYDQSSRGNRTQRIEPASLHLLEAALSTHYAAPQGRSAARSAAAVYRLYREQCQRQGLPPVSQQTFYRVRARFTTNEIVAKRRGTRAAYADQPFAWLDQTTPRHGDRPFALAHLDHTELDIVLVSSLTGKPLGKPWVTFLTDTYGRSWSFTF